MLPKIALLLYLIVFISSCQTSTTKAPLFTVLEHTQTGLDFNNKLTPTNEFNMFKYMYFYNGGGAGAGDFNKDGLIDLFFSANQTANKLYLNKGNLQFTDVTEEAKILVDSAWSTGVSIVDINNDGLLDIYVCRVGKFETLKGKNQLLVCKGINKNQVPFYQDEAAQYGLDFSGFSTQAAFFDYDMDGDLDMFLLNHSVHQNGTFAPRSNFLGTYNELSGDRFYRNDGNKFTDVTKQTGINSSAISYGLGVAVADINLDGYPDLYVGNDFHENDYLYINQKNGTFKETSDSSIMHTSQFSMGVDIADVNNDGYPEIVSMDMLPSDPYILKRSLGEDDYNTYNYKVSSGYSNQYTRNNLQLNKRNGMFSEVGLYSGIYATDWSWAPLWMDFNNDGLKDLFISNGIPKRMNDIDYVNFISNTEVQSKIENDRMDEKDMALVNKFPEIKIPNKFYKNEGALGFADVNTQVENDKSTYSNGAVYADFDNDGDLDVVVNNIDEPALLYANKSNDKKDKQYVALSLKGPGRNINAIGAKVILYTSGGIRTYENIAAKGFQSSMQVPMHVGLYNTIIDSAFLIWPDNSYQPVTLTSSSNRLSFTYTPGLPSFDYKKFTEYRTNKTRVMVDITNATGLLFKHKENRFVEFDREPLIPHMVSTEGPALSVADINQDGLEDIFIGSSKDEKSAVFLQKRNGKFLKTSQPSIEADSIYEDVDATWIDLNNDRYIDLVVASGGNEYYGTDKYLLPRAYINDGKGNLIKLNDAFTNLYITASSIVPHDFNGDGFTDLFLGGRTVPWEYGKTPPSYLLQNDGKGHFKNVTDRYSKELSDVGMVTQALWFDIDKDEQKDLLVCTEWGGIYAFLNKKGMLIKKTLTEKKGWWNFILPVDLDNDGDVDIIAGNLGVNSRLKASDKEPVKLYYNDFDGNGKKEQVITYFLNGREIPFANKDELQKQIPVIKKKFLYAEDFAKASLAEIFTQDKLKNAQVLTANYFSNAVLINNGKLNFKLQSLPWEAQLTSFKNAAVVDANKDNLPDILLAGNYYDNNIQMGRYDADFGSVLVNKNNGNFSVEAINGLQITGQVRHIKKIKINKQEAFILARNNNHTMVIQFKDLNGAGAKK